MIPTPKVSNGARVLPMLVVGVLCSFTAQQILQPVLPSLARGAGLTDVQLGLVISVAAAMLVIAAPAWGRACATQGHRRVLVTGLLVGTAGLTAFAAAGQLALAARLEPHVTFALFLATRGVLFGIGLAAVPVAATAYIAAATSNDTRTAALARLGAAQGLAVALGPGIGGLLAFTGLLGPLYTAPAVLAAVTVMSAAALPPTLRAPARPRATRGMQHLRDPTIWPYLLSGFTLFLALGLVLLTVGFLIRDRLALDPHRAAQATGAVSFACGLLLVATQGLLVPRLGWGPGRLLRTGTPVAAAALAGLAVAPGFWTILAAMSILALGLGIALPGYAAGPTLHVQPDEQGASPDSSPPPTVSPSSSAPLPAPASISTHQPPRSSSPPPLPA